MEIYVCKRALKESKELRGAIRSSSIDLYNRICSYESQGIPFSKIFNDDKVKYDKHGDFYTFKSQKSNLQLRILYSYLIVNDNPSIIIADYIVKKRNDKSYIHRFDSFNHIGPLEVSNTMEHFSSFN